MKKLKKEKLKYFSGYSMELYYNGNNMKVLDVELAEDSIGTPIVELDCGNIHIRLHIKEAIELKSLIDKTVFDWVNM